MNLAANRELGVNLNHKIIYRLIKLMGIKSVTRIKTKTHVKVSENQIAENILNRNFTSKEVNEKWLTNVTEFKTAEGKVYLSAILDLHNNRIVAHKFGTSSNNEFVFSTFKEAFENHPNAKPLIHSDRGYQYTSYGFKIMLKTQKNKTKYEQIRRMYR